MKCAKYLFVVFFGTLVYVLLSVFAGQNSVFSYKQMEEQKCIISKKTNEIQNINLELQQELTALKNDKAVISAYARKLDYVSDGEKLVKINGLKPFQKNLYDIGTVSRHEEPSFLPEKYCKMIAVFFSLLMFIIMILHDINKGNFSLKKDEKFVVTGVPVFDLPQI